MPKVVSMIPARLGSKRIKNKNLRLLGDKPLVYYVIETAKKADVFDDIYLNSESDVFADIANKLGVKFYKRKPELAGDDATNDQFVGDFLQHTDCDILIQINPTSPFYTVADITDFLGGMVAHDYDVMHGVKEARIETIFRGKALNFDSFKEMPRSQDLEPLLLHAGGLMGWKRSAYLANMKKYNCGTYGCGGKVGYFKLSGFSLVDIDNEEDFALAEIIIQYLRRQKRDEHTTKEREDRNE